jgi:hypothetical protein
VGLRWPTNTRLGAIDRLARSTAEVVQLQQDIIADFQRDLA